MNRPFPIAAVPAATLALVMLLSGCSAMENFLGGDKLDYRSNAQKTAPLEVPPDLTQLQREGRYQPQGGVVNASNYTPGAAGAPAGAAGPAVQAVAPQAVGDVRIERQGNARWLVTSQTPEQVWPQLRTFWQGMGFNIGLDSPETGVMETDWAENRAKLPQDVLRSMLGRVLDSVYSTGERDRFRTRVERTANGTEVTISHRGLEEVVTDKMSGSTTWQARANDPLLEGEMLSRLMVKLGAKEQDARAAVAASAAASAPVATAAASASTPAAVGAPRARVVAGQPATAQVDEPFDRAWRRVGLALDRSGFTVEDRDRANGVYYVRYVDPKLAVQEEPGFFAKLFGRGSDSKATAVRYRVEVQRSQAPQTTVAVRNAQGQPETSDIGSRIIGLLVDDLK